MVCDLPPLRVRAPVDPLCSVWIVSSEQLLAWTQNPTPVANLNNFDPLKCSIPEVDAKICNGMPQNEAGLLSHCAFPDFPFYTCVSDHPKRNGFLLMVTFSTGAPRGFRLPQTPTLSSLFLEASNHVSAVSFSCVSHIIPRLISCPVPANCSTPFWDPIAGNCLCTSDSCAFYDESRPIGVSTLTAITESVFSFSLAQPDGANLTGGGIGGNFSGDASLPTNTYVVFNGNGAIPKFLPSGWWQSVLLGSVGIAFGVVEVLARRV